MKAYKKSKLTYEDGYILKGDKVVVVNPTVVEALNKLDVDMQKAQFDKKRELANHLLDDAEFELKSEHAKFIGYEVETPTLDKAVEKACELMDELDACDSARKAKEYLDSISQVIEFVEGKKVMDSKCFVVKRFDLPTIGNPLELTTDELFEYVKFLFV